jgi:hypothetical protein
MYDRPMLFTGRASYYLGKEVAKVLRRFPEMKYMEL